MKIVVLPCDIKTVKVKARRVNGKTYATVSIPRDIVLRYDLKDKQEIVICYLCKSGQDCAIEEE